MNHYNICSSSFNKDWKATSDLFPFLLIKLKYAKSEYVMGMQCVYIVHNMPVTHMSNIIFFNQINAQHRHDKTFQLQLDAIKLIFPPISLDVVIFAWGVMHRTQNIFCWSFLWKSTEMGALQWEHWSNLIAQRIEQLCSSNK